MGDVANK